MSINLGCWLLVFGYLVLGVGCWLLVVGCWLLFAGYSFKLSYVILSIHYSFVRISKGLCDDVMCSCYFLNRSPCWLFLQTSLLMNCLDTIFGVASFT
jgi:hypothetical protein